MPKHTRTVRSALLAAALVTFAAVAFANVPAAASTMVVFGDSLSDSGNAAIAVGSAPGQVITGNTYVPSQPYASGTFSNGPVWASDVAAALGAPLQPSFAGGTNFAVGGATTGGSSPTSLLAQASQYLTLNGGVASLTALYVVEGGGNDARAALSAIAGGGDPATIIAATAASFASNIDTIVGELKAGGAGQIVVWNTPNVGLSPAIMALGPSASSLGTLLATQMNLDLAAALAGDTGVSIFDIFGLGTSIAANPAAFGLVNVTDACGAPSNACDPATAEYWDGIHPTATAHTLIADAFLAEGVPAVPEPSTWAMMLIGFLGLGFAFRQSRRRVCSPNGSYHNTDWQSLTRAVLFSSVGDGPCVRIGTGLKRQILRSNSKAARRPGSASIHRPFGVARLANLPIVPLPFPHGGGPMGIFHGRPNTKVASDKTIDRHRWT